MTKQQKWPEPVYLTKDHAINKTLRDDFAGKAMQTIIGSEKYGGLIGVNNYEHRCAADAYKMADAMLKERDK
jgi:hypothetical protein